MMNAAHLHLVTTHLPVVGTVFGFCLLLWSFVRRNEELKDISLAVFVLAAIMAVPAYFSGRPADAFIKGTPGLLPALIERHAEVALLAFVGMSVLGVASLAGLIVFRSPRIYPRWFLALALLLALAVVGLMGWTSNLGAQVRHAEIRAGELDSPLE
jgi:uncharacterized membrane protein